MWITHTHAHTLAGQRAELVCNWQCHHEQITIHWHERASFTNMPHTKKKRMTHKLRGSNKKQQCINTHALRCIAETVLFLPVSQHPRRHPRCGELFDAASSAAQHCYKITFDEYTTKPNQPSDHPIDPPYDRRLPTMTLCHRFACVWAQQRAQRSG